MKHDDAWFKGAYLHGDHRGPAPAHTDEDESSFAGGPEDPVEVKT